MEIKINRLFKTIVPQRYSASQIELGKDVGRITWNNALDAAPNLLNSADKMREFKNYIKGFGAWSESEIKAWTQKECNALLLQLIAGDIREAGLDTTNPDWSDYEKQAEQGRISGSIFKGIDGNIYYAFDGSYSYA